MKKQETLYVITGISRLTGDREEISIPIHESTAKKLLARWKGVRARRRDYLRLRMEPYSPTIFSKQQYNK